MPFNDTFLTGYWRKEGHYFLLPSLGTTDVLGQSSRAFWGCITDWVEMRLFEEQWTVPRHRWCLMYLSSCLSTRDNSFQSFTPKHESLWQARLGVCHHIPNYMEAHVLTTPYNYTLDVFTEIWVTQKFNPWKGWLRVSSLLMAGPYDLPRPQMCWMHPSLPIALVQHLELILASPSLFLPTGK